MTKEKEIMDFLQARVFGPILSSPQASEKLKRGVRLTIVRMNQHSAGKMIEYFWSAVIGTPRSIGFSKMMKTEGFWQTEWFMRTKGIKEMLK